MSEKHVFEIIIEVVPYVVLSLFGGFAELMIRLENASKIQIKFILSSFVLAAFVGIILALILYESEIHPALQGAIIGIAGTSSRSVMEVLRTWSGNIIKKVVG